MPPALSRTFSRALFPRDGIQEQVVLEKEDASCDGLTGGSRMMSVGRASSSQVEGRGAKSSPTTSAIVIVVEKTILRSIRRTQNHDC